MILFGCGACCCHLYKLDVAIGRSGIRPASPSLRLDGWVQNDSDEPEDFIKFLRPKINSVNK